MRANEYLKRLLEDLERWVRDGVIDQDTADALAADARAQTATDSNTPILASMAGLVVGLGVLTVIAANWSELTGIIRLGLISALLAAAILPAGWFRDQGRALPSNILSAVAVLFTGGAIVVVGQLYHSSSTSAAFLSVWAVMGLALTVMLRSPLAGALTALITLAWTMAHIAELSGFEILTGPIWGLIVLCLLGIFGWIWRTIGMLNVVFFALIVWINWTLAEVLFAERFEFENYQPWLILAALWTVIGCVEEIAARKTSWFATRTFAGWSLWTATVFVIMAILIESSQSGSWSILGGILALACFAFLTAYGAAPGRRWIRGAGVFGFIGVSWSIFSQTDDLLTAGFALIVFGGALTGLLIVTNRMLAKRQGSAS